MDRLFSGREVVEVVGLPTYQVANDERRATRQREPLRLWQPPDEVDDLPLQGSQHGRSMPRSSRSRSAQARRTLPGRYSSSQSSIRSDSRM